MAQKIRLVFRMFMKNGPLQIGFSVLFISSTFLLLSPHSLYPRWFASRLTGVGTLAVISALFLLPVFLLETHTNTPVGVIEKKYRALIRFEQCMLLGLFLNFIGVIGVFSLHIAFDKLVHFIAPCIAVAAGAQCIHVWFTISLRRATLYAASLVIASIFTWELLEFLSDYFLGTMSLGQTGNNVLIDTSQDLVAGLCGIAVAAFFTLKYRTRKRIVIIPALLRIDNS